MVNENKKIAQYIPEFVYSFVDMLVYQFYFPLFVGGPIITYDKFAEQVGSRMLYEPKVDVFIQKWLS